MFQKNETYIAMIFGAIKTFGFLAIFVIVGYIIISTQNLTIISLLVMMVLSLTLPIYGNSNRIDSWRAYQLNFIAPIFGLYVSILFWINKVGIVFNELETLILPSVFMIISACVVFLIHYSTREMSVIKGRIEKGTFVHNSGNLIAVIVLGVFIAFNVSDIFVLDLGNIVLMTLILGLYAFSSSFAVNSAYRRYKLNVNLKTEDVSKKIKILKEILLIRFFKKSNEIIFLAYLLERMTTSFISGDFERCFIDAVTIINDVTVVKSKPYRKEILKKEQWSKFSIIRAALVHSEIEEENEEGKKVRRVLSEKEVLEIKSHLYQSCIDIQKVVFEVVSLFCIRKK